MSCEPHFYTRSSALSSATSKRGASHRNWPPFRDREAIASAVSGTFHCLDLAGVRRAKPSLVVDIDNPGILEVQSHIRSMSAIRVNETERDGENLRARTSRSEWL